MYKKAIDILTGDEEIDYKKIAIQLAKENPEKFCEYHNKCTETGTTFPTNIGKNEREQYVYACNLLKAGNSTIECIKAIRGVYSIGLREAKDLVDLAKAQLQ